MYLATCIGVSKISAVTDWLASCFVFRHSGVSCMHARDLKYKYWREITQILQTMYLAYVPPMVDFTPFLVMTPQTLKRGGSTLCAGNAIVGPRRMVGQHLVMVGEIRRRLRLPTHRVGSKMVLLQLPLATRISWNHFGSFYHINTYTYSIL